MITYDPQLPCPLRASFSTDLNFLTLQTQMQGGYIYQRRIEPYIFRTISMSYRMSVKEFHFWWKWINQYGFGWHIQNIQGADREIRYIGSVDYRYLDYATVEASITAEQRLGDDIEEWAGAAPDEYIPGINDALYPDNVGSTVVDLDFREGSPGKTEVAVTAPFNELLFATSERRAIRCSFLAVSPSPVTIDIRSGDGTFSLYSNDTDYFRWTQDSVEPGGLPTIVGGDVYRLRISSPVNVTVQLYGYVE
jgi:hypothetical protein